MSDIFFTIHDNLPREAPGGAAWTRRALTRVTDLSPRSRILDVGCGTGPQTIELARAFGGRVIAVDLHAPYLAQLRRRALDADAGGRVLPVRASMAQLPFADASFDVIWSEGAIYIAGFARALRGWRRLLRPRGVLAVTELCWLVDDPPPAPRTFWSTAYPAMTTVARNLSTAVASGYEILESFALPESAWWDEYYGPLERRLETLRGERTGAADRAAIASTQEQIDLYRAHAASYGYVFFVFRRSVETIGVAATPSGSSRPR